MDRAAIVRRLGQGNVVLALLLALAAIAWAALARQGAGADMAMASPSMGMHAAMFLTVWVIMMVAMMLPTAAPMILTFHSVQASRRRRGEAFVASWVFVAGYMLVWTLSGVAAYAGAVGAEAIAARASPSPAAVARIGGGMLIAAGLYQLTPLKHRCLSRCRTPLGFVMTSWREGTAGALRMGLLHGGYCLGCCWLLFVILFPLGIMNLAAMAAITLVVLAEKAAPWGRAVAPATALALVAYGAVVLLVPRALPTFMAGGRMALMPAMAMPSGGAASGPRRPRSAPPAATGPAMTMPAVGGGLGPSRLQGGCGFRCR